MAKGRKLKIYYNGIDIYNEVSLNYCVHEMYAEKQADTLVLRFNDVNGDWSKWQPALGDIIRFVEKSSDTGKMFIHSMKPENGLFTIRAMSMPLSGKNRTSKSWDGVRFFQLGTEIAKKHDLTFKTYGCENHVYPYIMQNHESDFAFFSRLCTLEGYQMLVYDGALIVYTDDYIEKQTQIDSIEVDENGNFAYLDDYSKIFGTCEISSGSFNGKFVADSENKSILIPDFPVFVTSNAEATRFAKGLLRNTNKYGKIGKFSKSLLTGYAAASIVNLKTQKASMWNGNVFVYKVRHDFVGNKTTIYFRSLLEGY